MGRNRIINKKSKITADSILLSSFFPLLMDNNHVIMQDFQEGKFIKATCFNDFSDDFDEFELTKLKKKQYHIFSNIEEWKNFISKFNFTIGNRLYGSICSLNAGVPAVCCNSDTRAAEMCNYLKIPRYPNISRATDIMKLYEELDYSEMNKSYPNLYDKFEKFLNNNDLELVKDENKNAIEQPSLLQYKDNFNILVNNKKAKSDNIPFYQKIFSVRNEYNYKVIRILGIKIKFVNCKLK